jgi:hypothetical protein
MRNLAQVQAVRVELGGKTYLLRTDPQGSLLWVSIGHLFLGNISE